MKATIRRYEFDTDEWGYDIRLYDGKIVLSLELYDDGEVVVHVNDTINKKTIGCESLGGKHPEQVVKLLDNFIKEINCNEKERF